MGSKLVAPQTAVRVRGILACGAGALKPGAGKGEYFPLLLKNRVSGPQVGAFRFSKLYFCVESFLLDNKL